MYTPHDARRLRSRGPLVVIAYIFVVLLLTLGSSIGATLAQDDAGTPASDSGEVQVDQSADEPAEPPAEEQTEPPAEDEQTVDEPVTDEQPTDTVDEPDDAGTPDDSIPTEEPTDTPTPTATPPLPSLIVEQPVSARCELAPDQPDAVLSGGAQQYDCRAALGLAATAVDPAQVAIDWQIDVSTGGAWTAQLRTDAEQPWPDLETPPVLAAQSTLDEVVSAVDDSGFTTAETEKFQLLLTRPACDTTSPTVRVQVSANPSLDGAAVGQSVLPEPLRIEPALAAIAQPVVTFSGPLNFGTVSADASGPEVSSLSGSLDLQLSGMNATCGAWQISIGGQGMVDESGQSLPGSALLVLPATEHGVPCNVQDGCTVAQVAADPSAGPMQTLSLDLELRLGDTVVIGTFSTSLTVTITPLDALPSDGNGE